MGEISVLRICEHCDQEYHLMDIQAENYPADEVFKTKTRCPNCNEYDNPWICVKTDLFSKIAELENQNAQLQMALSTLAKWVVSQHEELSVDEIVDLAIQQAEDSTQ